jgi:hypothetical protein
VSKGALLTSRSHIVFGAAYAGCSWPTAARRRGLVRRIAAPGRTVFEGVSLERARPSGFRGPAEIDSRLPQAPPRRAAGLEAREGFGLASYGVTKMGGLRVATQLVSGASGCRRNEAMTDWAQGDSGATKCPTPGMLAILELGSVSAAA